MHYFSNAYNMTGLACLNTTRYGSYNYTHSHIPGLYNDQTHIKSAYLSRAQLFLFPAKSKTSFKSVSVYVYANVGTASPPSPTPCGSWTTYSFRAASPSSRWCAARQLEYHRPIPGAVKKTYENPYMTRFVTFTRVAAGRNWLFPGFRPCRNPSKYDEPCHIRVFVKTPPENMPWA